MRAAKGPITVVVVSYCGRQKYKVKRVKYRRECP